MPAQRANAPQPAPPLMNSVNTVVARTSISRTRVFAALASGELRSVKVQGRRLIPEEALQLWVRKMCRGSSAVTDGEADDEPREALHD